MAEYSFIPEGKLAPYIARFYFSDGYTPPGGLERVLPSGTAQLIINLGADYFRHFKKEDSDGIKSDAAIIAGVNSQYIFLDPQTRISTIGAIFTPGAIQALFQLPAIEFLDQAVSLSDVINEDIMALRHRLIDTASAQAKLQLLESFLMQHLDETRQSNAAIARAVQHIEHPQGMQSISDIAETVGYSRRRFSTLFQEAAGIAPKEYARIQRFQCALRTIRSHAAPDWPHIALSCRYYDQAHFNRDFKALAGITPGRYFSNKTSEQNHLPA